MSSLNIQSSAQQMTRTSFQTPIDTLREKLNFILDRMYRNYQPEDGKINAEGWRLVTTTTFLKTIINSTSFATAMNQAVLNPEKPHEAIVLFSDILEFKESNNKHLKLTDPEADELITTFAETWIRIPCQAAASTSCSTNTQNQENTPLLIPSPPMELNQSYPDIPFLELPPPCINHTFGNVSRSIYTSGRN